MEPLTAALTHPEAPVLALAAFAAGLVRGFSGFGTALVYLPVAGMVLSPFHAIATVITMDIFGPLPNVRRAWRDAERGDLARLVAGGVLGLPLGLYLLTRVTPDVFSYTVSAVALGMVLALILGLRLRRRPGARGVAATGAAGGFLGGLAGTPGPPVILAYMAGPHAPRVIRANTMLYLYFYDFFALAMLWWMERLPFDIAVLGLLLAVPCMVGNWLGGVLFRPELDRAYRGVAYSIITASALLGLPFFR